MDIVESIQRIMRILSRLGIHHGYHVYESGRVEFFGRAEISSVYLHPGRIEAAFPGYQIVSGPETTILLPEGEEYPENPITPQEPSQADYKVSEDAKGRVTFQIEGYGPFSLTAKSLELFLEYAGDAPNWSGTPWAAVGNVTLDRARRGNLTSLVKAGVVDLRDYDGDKAVHFTNTGRIVSAHYGYQVEEI